MWREYRRMEAIMAIEKISSVNNVASNYTAPAKNVQKVEPVEVTPAAAAPVSAPVVNEATAAKNQDGEASSKREQPSNEQLKKAVSEINKKMNANTSCQFGIHEATNRVMIKLIDNDTKEVIKEIPAEETLDIIAKAWELAGIMVDKKL